MSSPVLLNNIVVEFPDNQYILTVRKTDYSNYEHVLLQSCWKPREADLFRWFRNMKSTATPENGIEHISAMIRVFQTHQNELFSSLREYVLVEGIVETSYHLQLQDSDLVCEILNLMFGCWSSFGPLHFKAILGRRMRRLSRRDPDFLAFFLEHARRRQLQYAGIRMIDISVYSCTRKFAVFLAAEVWNWKQLLIYLQYGARFEKLFQDPTKSSYNVSSPLTDILRTLIRHLWFRLVSPATLLADDDAVAHFCMNLDADVKHLCRTFNILLRATRRIQHGSLDYIIRETRRWNRVILMSSRDVMNHCTVRIMIPKLLDRYECPEELKHVCRWTIREKLNVNWQLPHGIRQLPIPGKIQRYLNLLVD